MSDLPEAVRGYLDELQRTALRPCCLAVDAGCRILRCWGDPARHGLAAPVAGADVRELAPFLAVIDPASPQVLPLVNTGPERAADLHVLPAGQGGAYVLLLSADDTLRQRRAQQQTINELRLLSLQQRRLVERLIDAHAELDRRRGEAEEADRLKSRFIATMSHEFRTPLASVLGYADLLREELGDDPRAGHAQAIARAANHLAGLVDRILEQAQLERGERAARPRAVDLHELVSDLGAMLAPLAAEKGIGFAATLDPPAPPRVLIDETRLRQVLVNLLGNAVKFTDEGGVGLAAVWRAEELTVEVSDSGPGIAAADRERVFEPFARLAGAEGRNGSGLGLHITRELVDALGGAIELASAPGAGSRFSVRVPAPAAAAPAGEGRDSAVRRVLLVDDDPDIVRLMELYLRRAGFVLTTAANGEQAVEVAIADAPETVIMDLNMPVVDGLEAARRLRSAGFSGTLIALSGASGEEEQVRAIAAGFDVFVAKPMRMPELMAALGEVRG